MSKELMNREAIVEWLQDEEHGGVLLEVAECMGDSGICPFDTITSKFDIQCWYNDCGDVETFAQELLESNVSSWDIASDFRYNYNDDIEAYDECSVVADVRDNLLDEVIDWLDERINNAVEFDCLPSDFKELFAPKYIEASHFKELIYDMIDAQVDEYRDYEQNNHGYYADIAFEENVGYARGFWKGYTDALNHVIDEVNKDSEVIK